MIYVQRSIVLSVISRLSKYVFRYLLFIELSTVGKLDNQFEKSIGNLYSLILTESNNINLSEHCVCRYSTEIHVYRSKYSS